MEKGCGGYTMEEEKTNTPEPLRASVTLHGELAFLRSLRTPRADDVAPDLQPEKRTSDWEH